MKCRTRRPGTPRSPARRRPAPAPRPRHRRPAPHRPHRHHCHCRPVPAPARRRRCTGALAGPATFGLPGSWAAEPTASRPAGALHGIPRVVVLKCWLGLPAQATCPAASTGTHRTAPTEVATAAPGAAESGHGAQLIDIHFLAAVRPIPYVFMNCSAFNSDFCCHYLRASQAAVCMLRRWAAGIRGVRRRRLPAFHWEATGSMLSRSRLVLATPLLLASRGLATAAGEQVRQPWSAVQRGALDPTWDHGAGTQELLVPAAGGAGTPR